MSDQDSLKPHDIFWRLAQLHRDTIQRLRRKAELEEEETKARHEQDKLEPLARVYLAMTEDRAINVNLGYSDSFAFVLDDFNDITCRMTSSPFSMDALSPSEMTAALGKSEAPVDPELWRSELDMARNGNGASEPYHLPVSPMLLVESIEPDDEPETEF